MPPRPVVSCVIIAALFAAVIAALLTGRAALAQPPGMGGPVPVVVAPAIAGNVQNSIYVTGTVAPIEQVTIRSELNEQIVRLSVEEGDRVRLGQTVCELDKTDLLIAVDENRARLASARALLEELRAGSRTQTIAMRVAEVEEQRSIVEQEKLNWQRLRQLLDDDAVSQEEVDNARLDYLAAKARHEQAIAQLSLAREGARREEIARAEAELNLRQAELDRREQDLADATIVSPIPGAVSRKFTDQYAWVGVGDSILTVVNISQVKVRIDIPGSRIPEVRVMMPVMVTVDPMPATVFEGTLARINPQADLRTRSFPAEVLIDNPEQALKPGMFARMEIIPGERDGVTLVPVDAVVPTGRQDVVFVVVDEVAKAVPVETGVQTRIRAANAATEDQGKPQAPEPYVEIVQGEIKPGDLVVVRGNDLLQDNAPVVVLNRQEAGREDR